MPLIASYPQTHLPGVHSLASAMSPAKRLKALLPSRRKQHKISNLERRGKIYAGHIIISVSQETIQT